MAGPSPGVFRKWSIFLSFGRGVAGGVLPVGNIPGSLWALGVYGGGLLLIHTDKLASC